MFKRNKGQVLAAGLVLLALLAGFAGTTWGLIRAEERRVEAEAARAEEATQRSIAQTNEAQAISAKEEEGRQRAIAETEKQRAIESRNRALDALRATTGEDVEKLIGAKKVLSQNERAYLEAIARRWQLFATQEGSDQLSRAISGEGHLRVASLWDQLGRREDALREHEQAEKIYRELVAEFPPHPTMHKAWPPAVTIVAWCWLTWAGALKLKPSCAMVWPSTRNWPTSFRTSQTIAKLWPATTTTWPASAMNWETRQRLWKVICLV